MITLILVLCLVICIFGVIKNWEELLFPPIIIGILSFILLFILIGYAVDYRTIEPTIAVHQEENENIERSMRELISNFKQHESEIFSNVTPESAITLVQLYPELVSQELVQRQLEVYLRNNDYIRELRKKEVRISNIRWWLYFGR